MTSHRMSTRAPRVDEQQCHSCKTCQARAACRTKAMVNLDPGEMPFIDAGRCRGCRICMPACPFGAVVV